jgi:cysteine desulfurase/selenocysteine lyase
MISIGEINAERRREPDWNSLRRKFSVLSGCAYLDTAQHGPVSSDAAAAAREYYEDWSNAQASLAADRWNQAVRDCRREVAQFIGASESEVGLVPNTSSAMTAAALLFHGAGSVVTARGEHPTVVVPWLARNYRLDFAEPDTNGDFTAECYARALRPDSKIIAVSLVRYNDGKLNELEGLAGLARAHSLHLVVDAIQSIGIIPLNVRVGVDVACFAGFKWLNAGHGSGAVYVRSGLLERYGVPIGGNRSRRAAELTEISSFEPAIEARAFELGSACIPNALALRAALALLNGLGPGRVLARVQRLSALLRWGLDQLDLRTETDRCIHRSPHIVSAIVPDAHMAAERLSQRGVQVSARGRSLRIAVSWYNNEGDIQRCLAALNGCR